MFSAASMSRTGLQTPSGMRTSLPNLYFPVIADMAVKRYLNIFIFHGYSPLI